MEISKSTAVDSYSGQAAVEISEIIAVDSYSSQARVENQPVCSACHFHREEERCLAGWGAVVLHPALLLQAALGC